MKISKRTFEAIRKENLFSAHNYAPLPVVISKGKGVHLWDIEGKRYFDFISGISSVNQGHCHPAIISAFTAQASTLGLTSRALHNDVFGRYAEYLTSLMGMEMMLPTNTGAEAVETAMKAARAWAYTAKGVAEDKAIILSAKGNYHGRTISTISMSTDHTARTGYGPFTPRVGAVCPISHDCIPFNNIRALEAALAHHGPETAALLLEPIQGEAGIIVPDDGYLAAAAALCRKHNVLLILDEVQTGLGRTGKMSAYEYEFEKGVVPDLVTLGKSLSGGMYPVSAVVGRRDVLLSIPTGTHGSTFGGNPLASAVAIAALQAIQDDGLVENAFKVGKRLRSNLASLDSPLISNIRGKGLLNAITIKESHMTPGNSTWELCLELSALGLLARPTKGNIIRLIPPLCLCEGEADECVDIIGKALKAVC